MIAMLRNRAIMIYSVPNSAESQRTGAPPPGASEISNELRQGTLRKSVKSGLVWHKATVLQSDEV